MIGCAVHWDSCCVVSANLSTLQLTNVPLAFHPTMQQFIAILRRSTGLSVLIMHKSLPTTKPSNLVSSVTLNHLTDLTLQDSIACVGIVVGYLHVPNSANISIGDTSYILSPNCASISAVFSFISQHSRADRHWNSVHLGSRAKYTSIIANRGTAPLTGIQLHIYQESNTGTKIVYHALFTTVDLFRLTKLVYADSISCVDQSTWHEYLPRLSEVQELTVFTEGCFSIIDVLSTGINQTFDEKGVTVPVGEYLPNLSTLRLWRIDYSKITKDGGMDHLLQFLRSRAGRIDTLFLSGGMVYKQHIRMLMPLVKNLEWELASRYPHFFTDDDEPGFTEGSRSNSLYQ
jgi:hypothetical protein